MIIDENFEMLKVKFYMYVNGKQVGKTVDFLSKKIWTEEYRNYMIRKALIQYYNRDVTIHNVYISIDTSEKFKGDVK